MTDSNSPLTKIIQTLTVNINGINKDNQRKEFYQILNNKKLDIIFIQETHTNGEEIYKIRKGWNGKSIWHSGTYPKNSGVVILFSKSLNIEFLKI